MDYLGQFDFYRSGCKEDDLVLSIYGDNGIEILEKPTLAKNIKCPRCGGTKGEINPNGRSWHCIGAGCHVFLGKNRGKNKPFYDSISKYGVPEIYLECSIENCNQDQKILDFLSKFAKRPSGFVTIMGKSGNGKTFASCAVLEEYRRNDGRAGRFINVSDLYSRWREVHAFNFSERELMEPFLDPQLLVIDDIGTREPSPAFLEFLFLLIDKRGTKKNIGTILTTNLSNEEMIEALGARVLSRIGSGPMIVFKDGDRRARKRS